MISVQSLSDKNNPQELLKLLNHIVILFQDYLAF